MRHSSAAARERVVLVAVWLATYAIELVLEERKYGMFGGGFGQPHPLSGAIEIALFAAATLAAQALLVGFLYWLLRKAMPRAAPAARLFSFVVFACGIAFSVLAAKLELLSYFSDAVSFQLLRNLGGGSLADAFLFVLDESIFYIVGLVAAVVGYVAVLVLLRRRARRRGPPARTAPAFRGRSLAWLALVVPLLVFAAVRQSDVGYAARRMNAFAALSTLYGALTDVDRDGYSFFSAALDTAPFDPSRHPFALDVPGNGRDEDGYAGDFVDPGEAPRYIAPPLGPQPRHLVLVVLESTRADVLGKRIDGKPVAPNLEALARAGSVVPQAFSHMGFTTGSLKSLFSGQLDPGPGDGSLFRDLKRAGYRIGVFSGQSESFGGIAETVGAQQTADVFVDADTLKQERAFSFAAQGSLLVDEAKLLAAFERHLGNPAGWAQPTFVYFNFQSAHFPYHHPGMTDPIEPRPLPRGEIRAENRGRLERTYYNAVAYADQRLGDLIAELKRLGVWRDTLLVVTADHGESLFDDAFLGHGHMINRQQTQIPFVLSQPGVRIDWPVGLEDDRAILLALLAGRPIARSPRQPFQYVGALDTPAAIGIVDPGPRWTRFEPDTALVWFSESDRRLPYTALHPGSPERARADRLIREWERRRWAAHLARTRPRP